jgi:glycopeptide antibiotics resistance protein
MSARGSRQIEAIALGVSVAIILYATIWPFALAVDRSDHSGPKYHVELLPSDFLDFPRNVVLFMPLGLALAALLGRSRHGRLGLVLSSGFIMSVFVEGYQQLLPARVSNVSDVVANTLGAAAGLGCFELWPRRHVLRQKVCRHPVLMGSAYSIVLVLVSSALTQGLQPGRWDPSYVLVLGNEVTGDEPWAGTVANVVILDRAVDPPRARAMVAGTIPRELLDTVVADYSLNGEEGGADRKGNLPSLIPQAHSKHPFFSRLGVSIDQQTWLAGETAAQVLADRINRSRQFTVAMTVSPHRASSGITPILSFSKDSLHRNFTIGQDGSSLALRWRSVLTGENGDTPVVLFPHAFDSYRPQRVVVTSDGAMSSAYFGESERDAHIALGPELGLISLFRQGAHWKVMSGGAFSSWAFATFAIAAVAPLAWFMVTALTRSSHRLSLSIWASIVAAAITHGLVTRHWGGDSRKTPTLVGVSAACVVGLCTKWVRDRA